MAQYKTAIIEPSKGLNLSKQEFSLELGEASIANNVDSFTESLRKRNGYRKPLLGNFDQALKGGTPSQSIGVVGEEMWLDSRRTIGGCDATESTPQTDLRGRRDFFNQRPSIIVIPEGLNGAAMRLDVKNTTAPSWAFEIVVSPDEVQFMQASTLATSPVMVPIVCQKGLATVGQWAVRLIQDSTSDRFYAALTLYEGALLAQGAGLIGNPTTPTTNATDFFYNNGAARAWVEPGKRTWLAWKYIKGNPGTVTSYYWIEGNTSVVSSSQLSTYQNATLGTNGVGTGVYPVTIGRRPYQAAGRTLGGGIPFADVKNAIDEMGFVGSVAEMRFWLDSAQGVAGTLELPSNWATVTAYPPALTDWYVEREIPQEQLTTDATVESGNLVQTSDLQLYFQFKPELVGTNPDATTNLGENHRMLRPVFTRLVATDNTAWISGADATWVPGTGALGSNCLSLLPFANVHAQNYVFADVMRSGLTNSYHGKRLFCGGIRIPNSNSYIRRATTGTATGWEWPDEFSIRMPVRCNALPSSTAGTYWETLSEIGVARQGTAPNYDRYGLSTIWRVYIVWNGANWIFRVNMRDGAGAVSANVDSTTTVAEGTIYTVHAQVRFVGNTRSIALYINGAREGFNAVVATKPWVSQTSRTHPAAANQSADDDDGRDASFPFFLGCSVDTPVNVDSHPDPFVFRYGAYGIPVGAEGIGNVGSARTYWGWATNDTVKTANDGIGYRGHNPLVGEIGECQVWQSYLSESEIQSMRDHGPTGDQIQMAGSKLLSNWRFDEGHGTVAFDVGYLKNNLRINPFPTAKIKPAACDRVEKPPLLGVFQKRQLSLAGSTDQEVYAVAPGAILQLLKDSNGNGYLKNIGSCMTPQMWEAKSQSLSLPTAFQFSGALYVCPGLGPVKRVFNGKVTDAGLTPVFGNIGDDQTNLGWREFDRDGTFQITSAVLAASPAETVFAQNRKYGWAMTYYNPDDGTESAPSRLMFINTGGVIGIGANGVKTFFIDYFPHSPQRQNAKIRLYRTMADGAQFQLLAELSSDTNFFLDSIPDRKLQNDLTSWLNFPPPQNARIGMAFGSRALYFGVDGKLDTLFYSLQGQPGACPPQYQIGISSGQSTELTGGVVINDRAFVFTRTSAYAVFDSGGDIAIDSQEQPPVQLYLLRDDLGCISHHGIVTIEGFGAIIPTERGLYLFDGNQFVNLGGTKEDRIQPFWESLNLTKAQNFVAVAHRRKKQYILFCSTGCSPGPYNDRAIVYDWGRQIFSIQTQRDVLSTAVIVDEATAQERVWCGTLDGSVFEFDPPEVELFSDGPTAAPFSGSIVSAKKDPLGSGKYTRLTLVSDSSLATAGTGLRGVNLYTTNDGAQWHTQPLKILWNDANSVLVDAAAAATLDPTTFEWRLGPIGANWRMVNNLGSDVSNLRVLRCQFNLESSMVANSQFVMQCGYDDHLTSKFGDATKSFVVLAGVLGRGRRVVIQVHDITRYGGLPNNPWAVANIELNYQLRGRASYVSQ